MRIRSVKREEIPQVLDLIQEAFTHYGETPDEKNGALHYEMFADVYAREDLDPELVIVAEEDGKFVSMASWLPKRLRVGARELPGVVLSPVGTRPEHRGRGIAEQVLRHGLALAKEKGHVFSAVLGHPTYYPRVGYVPVFSWYRAAKGIERLDGIAAADVREARESDAAAMAELYDREMAEHLFHPVRGREFFARELAAAGKAGHLFSKKENVRIFERDGRVVAYAHVGDAGENLAVQECCLESYEQAAHVYQALMGLAKERGKAGLECPFPLVTAFGVFFKMQGPEVRVNAPSAWMMQVLDWEAWMDAHMARHGMDDAQVRVEADGRFVPSAPLALQVKRGEQSHRYETSSLLFTQLMMGRYTLQDLLVAGAIRLPVADAVALGSLLPKQGAYFNIGDALF